MKSSCCAAKKKGFFWPLLLCMLCMAPLGTANASKTLYLFAGPHNAGSSSVEDFFYRYAWKMRKMGDKQQRPLKNYKWPRIEGRISNATEPDEPYKIFNHLVTEPHNINLRNEIYAGIRQAWQDADLGVIVGAESFDQVGDYANNLGLEAMKNLVKELKVAKQNVVVLINYRTPRFEQWVSVYKHNSLDDEKYKDWMCSKNNYEQRINFLQTALNPLGMAAAYLAEGWQVKLMDLSGMDKANRDVTHVIACEVLPGTVCNDAKELKFYNSETPYNNAMDQAFTALSEAQVSYAEKMFRYRDCSYKEMILSQQHQANFDVLYQDALWDGCLDSFNDIYETIRDHGDPALFYKALLSQVKCDDSKTKKKKDRLVLPGEMYTMDDVLAGDVPFETPAEREHKLFFLLLIPIGILVFVAHQKGFDRDYFVELFLKFQLLAMEKYDEFQNKRSMAAVSTYDLELSETKIGGGGGGYVDRPPREAFHDEAPTMEDSAEEPPDNNDNEEEEEEEEEEEDGDFI